MSQREAGGTVWDAPNQQVVRDDSSPPWEEGTGGEGGSPVTRAITAEDRELDLDSLTKDELLSFAKSLGISPANAAMTKDELRAGVDSKLAGG